MPEEQTPVASLLASAMLNLDARRVEGMLRQGADIFTTNRTGQSLLAEAVLAGEQAAKSKEKSVSGRMFAEAQIKIAALFRARADALSPERFCLADAVAIRNLDALRLVLAGDPPNEANESGYTAALSRVVRRDDAEMLRMLLAAGVSVNVRAGEDERGWNGWTMLGIAAAVGSTSALRLLVEHGADVNARLPSGMGRAGETTALMAAAGTSNLAAVKLLMEAGADLGARDAAKKTALDHARRGGFKRVIATLEAAFETRDVAADLDLCAAAVAGVAYRVRALLDQGAEPDQHDTKGQTALMLAIGAGQSAIVQMLCEAGADVRAVRGGDVPADLWAYAFTHPKPDVIDCLLRFGLDPNAPRPGQVPPLILALRPNDKEIIRVMLAHGADPLAPVPADLLARTRAAQERTAQSQAFLARRLGRTPPPPPAATGQTCSILDYAGYFTSRENYELLAPAAGAVVVPAEPSFYERLQAVLKSCAALADEPFMAEAARLGDILHAKPQPWKRRKGVVHFVSSMTRCLAAHYGVIVPDGGDKRAFGTALLRRLQAEVAERGYTLVYTGFSLAHAGPVRLLLFPVDEPLAVLAACGTNAANYGLGARDVVAWCEEARRVYPLTVIGAGFDFMELGFSMPIADSAALARRLAEFCRDLQVRPDDPTAVARFARELEASGSCFLWWD